MRMKSIAINRSKMGTPMPMLIPRPIRVGVVRLRDGAGVGTVDDGIAGRGSGVDAACEGVIDIDWESIVDELLSEDVDVPGTEDTAINVGELVLGDCSTGTTTVCRVLLDNVKVIVALDGGRF